MPNGHITPDTTGLLDYVASRSTSGQIDDNQLLANIILGTSGQIGFATNDTTGLLDYVASRTTSGQLPLMFERLPNLKKVVRWT